VWVGADEDGFISAAEKLGVQVLKGRRRSGSAPGMVETTWAG